MLIGANEILQLLRGKGVGSWNRSPDSATRSTHPEDASNRIYDGFADIGATYDGPRFAASAPVFAMGSCFAREIESALKKRGGNIISIDDTIRRPEFADEGGQVRSGFFHRYTPASMVQEFRWPFGRQEGWSDQALVFDAAGNSAADLNYAPICADNSRAAIQVRRDVAGALVRKLVRARIIIVTLGLTEGWIHRPSGLAINSMNIKLLRSAKDEFALQQIEYDEVMAALDGILGLIEAEHVDGDYQFFVTVSPVPFRATFMAEDVVQANMTSKSTLRAAAVAFARRNGKVHYFPSYELVVYSNPKRAWRPDRVHVQEPMVRHIMDRFISTVYEDGALPPR